MATRTLKLLANGQLPNAKGTLYTCPALTSTLIKTITLVNAGAADHTANIYVKRTTSRRIKAKDFNISTVLEEVVQQNIILEAGDLIEGDADAATTVDYCIFGIEQT